MEVLRKELLPSVMLTAVQTDKFKSSCLSLSLLAPMDVQTVTGNALLPYVLRRGTVNHPDNRSVSLALDELCGGTMEARVRQQGEYQCVGFIGSFLDDVYSPDGSAILEPAAALMGEMLLHPVLENGEFRGAYVSGEGKNLADRIHAQINEKRQYSIMRLTELMCADEPYGLDKLGFADQALSMTAQQLWTRYQDLLATAPICLYYCGSASFERVENALRKALSGLPRESVAAIKRGCPEAIVPEDVRYFTDTLDVTQGKLALGWRTGGVTLCSEDYPALLVLNSVYGGTTTSKLFMNVRERLSLCYFAGSMLDKLKGLMVVSSGIEFDQYERARDEIVAQFEACVKGDFTERELEAGRRAVISSLTACQDSQMRLEDYWMGQYAAGTDFAPEELTEMVGQVTAEQISDVAKKMKLDSVYFLKGREA